jgi:predicted component of type VI protein secretion system
MLSAQRTARVWHSYHVPHQNTVQALAEDVDSAFGKMFAQGYERAVDEISARDQG